MMTLAQASQTEIRKLVVLLIKPTKYDRNGYPLRFLKGVLPSNSLAVMYSLTQEAFASESLAHLNGQVYAFDELVWNQRVDNPAALVRRFDDGQTKIVVGLVAVQTNQFPRALDLGRKFKQAGADVVIGGFHVSGSISTLVDGIASFDPNRKTVPSPHRMPDEIQILIDERIIICHGEAESVWTKILSDIVQGKAEPIYRNLLPDIGLAPMPLYPPRYFWDFAVRINTLDTCRGCILKCSFCTIINVQGRKMRYRLAQVIVNWVKQICDLFGQFAGFLTDDNFGRNPDWPTILDGLIDLRRLGYRIHFMIESDLDTLDPIKHPASAETFASKLAAAGCGQVFMGMETVRPEALKEAEKLQNKPEHYRAICDLLHAHGISVHAGYIIGFKNDTPQTILEDVETIKSLGVDQVSFFILTPLPGSEDHVRLLNQGVWMDPDFNRYDSFEPVTKHPYMSREQLINILYRCFKEFYRSKHLIASLKHLTNRADRLQLIKNDIWYRNSALGEGIHPMNCGFWSKRKRSERRPGLPRESFWTFWRRELIFRLKYCFGHLPREFYIFQHVYYEAELKPALQRLRPKIAGRLAEGVDKAKRLEETIEVRLSQKLGGARDWFNRTFRMPPTRRWLNLFWIKYGQQKWNLLKPWHWHWHLRMIPYCITEIVYTLHFLVILIKNFRRATHR